MGGRLLRRKDILIVLASALLLGGTAAWAGDSMVVQEGPLPPLQGHEGVELYSFPVPDEDIIERYVQGFLATRRDWLQAVLDRSRSYQASILGALVERGLPRELLYLPAVESGFVARATSPRGAAGLWQLMRTTATPYGLRIDQWVDERRDFMKSTEASLDKLTENHRIFGDWYLALAAYNCGVGKLTGIMKKSPGSDYWTLRKKGLLPRETAGFVPQFLALSRIFSYPGRYDLQVGWEPLPEWTRIPLASSIDLRILARSSGVPLAALVGANPELNFPITPPGSYGYSLKVPAMFADAVEATLGSATIPLLDFLVHVVVPGDTLSELARRYGITVEMLQEFNPRIAPRALQIGARILVPTSRRSG